jgi:hypothetical protein
LFVLRSFIKTCIATYAYHGVLAAEDFRRATARNPELRQMPMKTALDLALYRLEKLIAERDAVPEQAPAVPVQPVEPTPVPPQAPAPPRAKPVEGASYRQSPRDGLKPFLPAAEAKRTRQETRAMARRVLDAATIRRCGSVVDLTGFNID